MKHILFIFLFNLFFLNSKAQNFPAQGSYITNNTMGAFHGTWLWVSGMDTVKIYLITKKIHFTDNDGFDIDCIVGWHVYKRGNVVIESNYANINNTSTNSLTCSNEIDTPDPLKVKGDFKDLTKNKHGNVTLTLNAAGNQLTWKLENSPGAKYRRSTDPPYDWNFTLPENIVFTKL
jgi:hypothetical protein